MAKPPKRRERQQVPKMEGSSTPMEFERTLAIIKPNALSKIRAIYDIIERHGLLVLNRRRVYLKPEQARDFYIQSKQDEDTAKYYKLYEDLVKGAKQKEEVDVPLIRIMTGDSDNSKMNEFVDFMTSGPIEIIVIAGRGAVTKWRKIIGPESPKVARETHPESIRAQFGGETTLRNAVHGSISPSKAEREIKFFFPESRFELENKIGTSGEYLSKTVNPILLKGLIQLCRQKPDNPLVWLADWLLANNPNAKP